MKEKWIIKLIKLLNEYLNDGQERLYACHPLDEDFDKFFHTKDWEWIIEEAQVISKKFWFIKWLILNDKINFYKLEDDSSWYNIDTWIDYLDMLALLSIQDNPIEFLVSILK